MVKTGRYKNKNKKTSITPSTYTFKDPNDTKNLSYILLFPQKKNHTHNFPHKIYKLFDERIIY